MTFTTELHAERSLVRKLIITGFNGAGRPLTQRALDYLTAELCPLSQEARNTCLKSLLSNLVVGPELTLDVQEVVAALGDGEEETKNLVQIISAFSVPKPAWDASRTRFYVDAARPTLFPPARAKADVPLARLQMVAQRLARNPDFSGRALRLSAADQPACVQLTQVKGLSGGGGATAVVLGMLRRDQSGHTVLEDASGVVRVDLSHADVGHARGFVAEGSMLLLEGGLQPGGLFLVKSVLEPPLESRTASVASLYGLSLFGGEPLRAEDVLAIADDGFAAECRRLAFVAGCHLNEPSTLARLGVVLDGYEGLEEGPPAALVLIGPFFSPARPPPPFADMRAAFAALATLIARFPKIQEQTDLVLVPAAGDPGCCGALPQAPLSPSVAQPLRRASQRVTLATNPCRVQFYTKQIVVFADRLVDRFKRQQMLLPPPAAGGGAAATADSDFARACHSVLAQSHLSPFAPTESPCWWQHDHALSLFPAPDALILAGSGAPAACNVAGTRCINPGLLGDSGFAALIPSMPDSTMDLDDPWAAAGEVELCEVPERAAADDDEDDDQPDAEWYDGAEASGDERPAGLHGDVDSEDDFEALDARDLQVELDEVEATRRGGGAQGEDLPATSRGGASALSGGDDDMSDGAEGEEDGGDAGSPAASEQRSAGGQGSDGAASVDEDARSDGDASDQNSA